MKRLFPLAGAALAGATQVTSSLFAPIHGATRGLRRSMGAGRSAIRRSGIASPRYHDGIFHNTEPMRVVDVRDDGPIILDWIRRDDRGQPTGTVSLARPELPAQASAAAATWLGHATVLLEIDGAWVLCDPVWSERVSPSSSVGPKRNHAVPMSLDELPELAAVLISHDHYDHLDTATIDALVATQSAPFVVPLGIGAHLLHWGVPRHRIVELDWDDSHRVGGLTFTCTEARHFSGRGLSRNNTLWASWVIAGESHRVFFGGDSGYTKAFKEIGDRHGPFDLTILPIGAYDVRWPDVHMNPEEAVRTHLEMRGEVLLPIHWATFDLAFHAWADPIEWLLTEAASSDVRVAAPRPGQRVDLSGELPTEPWWELSTSPGPAVPDRRGRRDRSR